MKTVNSLKHTISIDNNKGNYQIDIRLSDDCKNGHNDFAITATFWQVGKERKDRFCIAAGCCHDKILKFHPELKIFVDLHLSDVNGAPMYAIGNGFYHLKNGFNNTKQGSKKFSEEFKEYYRLTPEQFRVIATSEDEKMYHYWLTKLGVFDQWKRQANEAIKILESFTGLKFKDDSRAIRNFKMPADEMADIEKLINSGYYSPKKIKERAEDAEKKRVQKQFSDLKEKLDEKIKTLVDEYNVELAVLSYGFSLDNFIYYNHTNTGKFNWKSYESKITKDQFNGFVEFIKTYTGDLPEDITFQF